MTIQVERRVILSGTPIQNDLSEYFSLLNFANPDFLGSKMDFRKNYENAIIKGRDADATDGVKAESEKKLKELGGLVAKFIIRRTNDLLSKYCKYSRRRRLVVFELNRGFCQCLSSMSRSSSAVSPLCSLPFTGISLSRPRSRSSCVAQAPNHSRRSASSRSSAIIPNCSICQTISQGASIFCPMALSERVGMLDRDLPRSSGGIGVQDGRSIAPGLGSLRS